MTQIKAAMRAGMRPGAHIVRPKDPYGSWSGMDYVVAEAFQRLEDETCPECGNPMWVCRSRSNDITFPVYTDTCRVEKAKQEAAKDRRGKERTLKPGEFRYVVPKMRGSAPMVTREDYLKTLDEEQKLHTPTP